MSVLSGTADDVRYAARTLRKSPGFTAAVILSLALGVGANTAIFSVVDALLLRPLPVRSPAELVIVGNTGRVNSVSAGGAISDIASVPLYQNLRDNNRSFSGLAASGTPLGLDVIVPEGTAPAPPRAASSAAAPPAAGTAPANAPASRAVEHPRGRFVSSNYFSVLGVGTVAGVPFAADADKAPGADPVAVLSYGYWQRRFAGDRGVVGKTITVNNVPLTVVGVAARDFGGDAVGQTVDLWIPVMMQRALMPGRAWLDNWNVSWLLMYGRLKPNVTAEGAQGEMTTLVRHAMQTRVGTRGGPTPDAAAKSTLAVSDGSRGASAIRGDYRRPLAMLMVAVAVVLIIVCANVANLLLARSSSRSREIGVRIALGAGRGRIQRQLLTEGLLLAVTGGAAGVALARPFTGWLLHVAATGPNPIPLDVTPDLRVLAFAAGVALASGLLFALVPAMRASRVEPGSVLRSHGRGLTGGAWRSIRGRWPLGKALVALQVALSIVVLVATSMLVRTVQRLVDFDAGFARNELLMVNVEPAARGYTPQQLPAMMGELSSRLAKLPGVTAVSYSQNGIFSGTESGTNLQIPGFTARTAADTTPNYDVVGPGYFATVGARIVAGRGIDSTDVAGAHGAVVINETGARHYFGDTNPIGREVVSTGQSYTVVGVVADLKARDLREPPSPRFYFPLAQSTNNVDPGRLYAEVRTATPTQLVRAATAAVDSMPNAPRLATVTTLATQIDRSIGQDRLAARMITLFGVLALLLAATGLYGVMTYLTGRRTGEFGLRLALGAQPGAVTRMVLGEVSSVVVVGAAVGLPAALASGMLFRHQLFGVGLVDVPSLVAACAVLAVAAALAGWLPARRAARVAPFVALREE